MALTLASPRPAHRTPPPDCLAPTEVPWNGRVVGCYARNSTSPQKGNARSRFQTEDMPAYLMGLGYAVRLYEEQGVSGAIAVHKRRKMSQMLADLKEGDLDGVAAVDEKRLTRDEFGADTATIIRTVRERGGLAITFGKVLDLRRKGDVRTFELMTKIGGWERIDLRDQMHQGLLKEFEVRPLFRGRAMVGFKRIAKLGPDGQPLTTRQGRVKTDVVKDPAYAETMAEVVRQFGIQPTLTEVAAELNRRGVKAPWTTYKYPWSAARLRKLLRNPWYWGDVPLVREVAKPDVWINLDRDPTALVHRREDLAYWTRARARAWLEALDHGKRRTRYRGHGHLLVDVLACASCHAPMGRGGTTRNGGVETHRYACPDVNMRRSCPSPQWLSEEVAFRELRRMLPRWLPEAQRLAEAARRRLAAQPANPAQAQLDALLETEEYLTEKYVRNASRTNPIPERVERQLDEMDAEKKRLRALLEKDETTAVLSGQAIALAERLRDTEVVLAGFDEMTREQQAEFYKLLVRGVEIAPTGGRGKNARFEVVGWRLQSDADNDTSPTRYLANLTRLLPEAAAG